MKTNINYQHNSSGEGSKPQRFTLTEALVWFCLAALALFILGTPNA